MFTDIIFIISLTLTFNPQSILRPTHFIACKYAVCILLSISTRQNHSCIETADKIHSIRHQRIILWQTSVFLASIRYTLLCIINIYYQTTINTQSSYKSKSCNISYFYVCCKWDFIILQYRNASRSMPNKSI